MIALQKMHYKVTHITIIYTYSAYFCRISHAFRYHITHTKDVHRLCQANLNQQRSNKNSRTGRRQSIKDCLSLFLLTVLKENIRTTVNGDTEEKLATVDAAIREKQDELLNVGKDQTKIDEIGDAIISLRQERQGILTAAAKNTELQERIDDLAAFMDEQTAAAT